MSYLDVKYPDSLDFTSINGLIKGDWPTKAKAETHIQGFVLGKLVGEPKSGPPVIGSLGPDDTVIFLSEADVDAAAPFEAEEAEVKTGPITDVILIARLVATLRKYAPDAIAWVRKFLKK